MKTGMQHWWNDTGRENRTKHSQRSSCQCPYVHYQPHAEWPGIEPGPIFSSTCTVNTLLLNYKKTFMLLSVSRMWNLWMLNLAVHSSDHWTCRQAGGKVSQIFCPRNTQSLLAKAECHHTLHSATVPSHPC